jgi:cobalt-zinc-cadmium efflux system outer membrane protein
MFKDFTCQLVCSVVILLAPFSITFAQTINPDISAATTNQGSADAVQLHKAEIEDLAIFVNAILRQHPGLKAAESAKEEAIALERQAGRPIYNPELGADYEDAVDKTYEIGIFQAVDWAGKRDAAYAVSSFELRSAEAKYVQTRNEIAAQILENLSEYWTALTRLQLITSSKSLMHDFARQAGMRYQAGDMMRVEYETAQLAYAESRMRMAEAEANVAALANGLMAFGAPVDTISWPSMPSVLPEHVLGLEDVNTIVEQLPEVMAAKAEAQTAEAGVEVAESLKKPDPTFGVRVGEEDKESLVGISFSIPLYVRNSFDDNVMAAISAQSRAEAQADTIVRLAKANLTISMIRFSTMRKAWIDWEKVSSVSLDTQTKLLTRLWDARELNMSEFLLQFRQTLEAQKTAVELRQTLWQAWISYLQQSNQVEYWLSTTSAVQTADELRGINNAN